MCHRRMDPSLIHPTRLTLAKADVHAVEVADQALHMLGHERHEI